MELKKNPKANVGRNSSLYFAVGLNVMLVLTYLGLEHKTYDKSSTKIDILMLTEQLEEEIPITTINIGFSFGSYPLDCTVLTFIRVRR